MAGSNRKGDISKLNSAEVQSQKITKVFYFKEEELSIPLFYTPEELSIPLFYKGEEISIPVFYKEEEISIPLFYLEKVYLNAMRTDRLGWNTLFPELNQQHIVPTIQYARSIGVLNDKNILTPITKIDYDEDDDNAVSGETIDVSATHYTRKMGYVAYLGFNYQTSGVKDVYPTVFRILDNATPYNTITYPHLFSFLNVPVAFPVKVHKDAGAGTQNTSIGPVVVPYISHTSESDYKTIEVNGVTHNAGVVPQMVISNQSTVRGYKASDDSVFIADSSQLSVSFDYQRTGGEAETIWSAYYFNMNGLNIDTSNKMLILFIHDYCSYNHSTEKRWYIICFKGPHNFTEGFDPIALGYQAGGTWQTGFGGFNFWYCDDVASLTTELTDWIAEAGATTDEGMTASLYLDMCSISSGQSKLYRAASSGRDIVNNGITFTYKDASTIITSVAGVATSTKWNFTPSPTFWTNDYILYTHHDALLSKIINSKSITKLEKFKATPAGKMIYSDNPLYDCDGCLYKLHIEPGISNSTTISMNIRMGSTSYKELSYTTAADSIDSYRTDAKIVELVYEHGWNVDHYNDIFDPLFAIGLNVSTINRLQAFAFPVQFDYGNIMLDMSLNVIGSGVIGDNNDVTIKSYMMHGSMNKEDESRPAFIIDRGNMESATGTTNFALFKEAAITERYSLTKIQFRENNNSYCYYGVLDEETKRHYSPLNISENNVVRKSATDSIVSKIEILDNIQNMLAFIVVRSDGTKYYMKLYAISETGVGKLIKSKILKKEKLLEEYYINSDNNIDVHSGTRPITQASEVSELSEYGRKSHVNLIFGDKNILYYDGNTQVATLNASQMYTHKAFNMLDKNYGILNDVGLYALNSKSIQIYYPTYYFGISSCDVLEITAPSLPDTTDESIPTFSEYCYKSLNAPSSSMVTPDLQLKPFSIIVMNMPFINMDTGVYDILPTTMYNVFGHEYLENFGTIGNRFATINNKKFVIFEENIYESSCGTLCVKDNTGLLESEGTVYSKDNLIFCSGSNGTSIYVVDENHNIKYLKTVSGSVICDPVNIGDDYLLICKTGIYSYKRDLLHSFLYPVTDAVIKPNQYNGMMLLCKCNDTVFNQYIGLATTEEFALIGSSVGAPAPSITSPWYFVFLINQDLSISELVSIDQTEYNAYSIIHNRHIQRILTNYFEYYTDATKLINKVYIPVFTSDYPDRLSDEYNDILAKSQPYSLRTFDGKIFSITAILIEINAVGPAILTFKLYNKAYNVGDTPVLTKSISITGDLHKTYRIETGIIAFDQLYYIVSMDIASDVVTINNITYEGFYDHETLPKLS